MLRIILPGIFIIISLSCYSQQIQGIVLDENTFQPLVNVSVFFNGTTVGTRTDSNGKFQINIPGNQKLPLAVSAIGYNSLMLKEYYTDKMIKILLIPRIYELDEVIITSKKMTWRERSVRNHYVGIFRKQFLGETVNSYTCKILNESDLVFKYYDKENLLTAYSTKPLEITNKALGYKIIFYLDEFKFSLDPYLMTYTGYCIFREDSTLSEKAQRRAEKRRRLAYLGSRMHFMRSLWNNNLDSSGFTIKDSRNKIILADSLVCGRDSSEKYIINKGRYSISFFSKVPRSTIELISDTVYFNKLGYFDPYSIKWIGEMGKQRVADLLPYDFKLK